jgi:hypothetical protein
VLDRPLFYWIMVQNTEFTKVFFKYNCGLIVYPVLKTNSVNSVF